MNIKHITLSVLLAISGLTLFAPTVAEARPYDRHKVCHFEGHHHHRVCHWVR